MGIIFYLRKAPIYTTFNDVDAAVLSGKMTKQDLFFDVKRGICTVVVTDDNLRALDGRGAVSRGSYQRFTLTRVQRGRTVSSRLKHTS